MIEIRALVQEDLKYVRENPLEDAVKGYPDMPIDYKTSYTALLDGRIVGVGGASMMWKGVWEFWLIMTKDPKREGVSGIIALRVIRRKIDEIIEENNIFRAQATVRIDFPKGIKMLEILGFQREGLLRKYCPDGMSSYRYSKIGGYLNERHG